MGGFASVYRLLVAEHLIALPESLSQGFVLTITNFVPVSGLLGPLGRFRLR